MSGSASSLLTPAERECLDRVLAHQTAKEMARDLGISHHAVEKRLKRARQKVGAAKSLEAARLYAQQYGQTVSGSPDLHAANHDPHQSPPEGRTWRHRHGRLAMTLGITLTGAVLLGLWQNAGGELADPYPVPASPAEQMARGIEEANRVFARLDRDQSGFIDEEEFVAKLRFNTVVLTESSKHPELDLDKHSSEARDRRLKLFTLFDRDGNGTVDQYEFRASFMEWQGSFAREADSSNTSPKPLNGEAFAYLDADESGYIERDEFPDFPLPGYRTDKDGDEVPIALPKDSKADALDKAFGSKDLDGDGRLSRGEFGDGSVTFRYVNGQPVGPLDSQ